MYICLCHLHDYALYCIYTVKEVRHSWELSQLIGVERKRTCTQATDQLVV